MHQAPRGLRQSPFRGGCNPQFFYLSPIHEEALARLYFLVEQRRRLGLLMGPPGSGKSLLLEVFARQLRRQGRPVAKLSLLGVGATEVLALLARELSVAADLGAAPAVLWRAICDRLTEYRFEETETIVLLDDADQAQPQVVSQVTRLALSEFTADARLTIVLAGQQSRMGRVGRRLLDLAELRIDLDAWQPDDTEQYVRHSLAEAGFESAVFEQAAIDRLHTLAQGIPRRVTQLADLALLAAVGRQAAQIDAELVESVYNELGVVEV